MTYLYHFVPKNLQGDVLYPLNVLKEKYPAAYEEQASKYIGREHIMLERIPILNCLWNDVLHFSVVNPKEIKQALIEAGRKPDFTMEYYQVDPKLLEPKNTVIYLYAHADNRDEMSEENFAPYSPDEVVKFSEMPQATKDYYKEMIKQGKRPLLYHKIPHVLYRGALDVADTPVTSV